MIAAAYGVVIVALFVMAGRSGTWLGTDFFSFYAVSLALHDLSAPLVYDPAALVPFHKQAISLLYGDLLAPGKLDQVQPPRFYYPPTFLLALYPLAWLPPGWAHALWNGVTLAPYLIAMRGFIGSPVAWTLALAFPAVAVNGLFGQNGFLTAGLLGFGLLMLTRHRPIAAGLCFGLLAYKPQLALLLPLALLAAGQGRAIAAAAVTACAVAGLSLLAFGPEVWGAFLRDASPHARAGLESGTHPWSIMPTVFVALRMAGTPVAAAYAAQAATACAAIAAVLWSWRKVHLPMPMKAAILCPAIFLATPFAYSYDLVLLGLPLALLTLDGLNRGWRPGERLLLAAALLLPFLLPLIAKAAPLQIGPLVIGGLLLMAVRRAADLR